MRFETRGVVTIVVLLLGPVVLGLVPSPPPTRSRWPGPSPSPGQALPDLLVHGNWSATAAAHVWCTGSGTAEDPYTVSGRQFRMISLRYNREHCVIANCTTGGTTGIREAGIYLRDVENATLAGNTCRDNNNDGIYLRDVENVTLAGNTCRDNNNDGIYLRDVENVTLAGNTCRDNNNDGIYLRDVENATLADNTCRGNQEGISLRRSRNVTLRENTCERNQYDGIILLISTGVSILENVVSSNNHSGVVLSSSTAVSVTRNCVQSHPHNEIILLNASHVVATNNTFDSHYKRGTTVCLSQGSRNNSLRDNRISRGFFGVYIYTDGNEVSGNYLSSLTFSAIIIGADARYNRVRNNTITNCSKCVTVYASDESSNAVFDNACPVPADPTPAAPPDIPGIPWGGVAGQLGAWALVLVLGTRGKRRTRAGRK